MVVRIQERRIMTQTGEKDRMILDMLLQEAPQPQGKIVAEWIVQHDLTGEQIAILLAHALAGNFELMAAAVEMAKD